MGLSGAGHVLGRQLVPRRHPSPPAWSSRRIRRRTAAGPVAPFPTPRRACAPGPVPRHRPHSRGLSHRRRRVLAPHSSGPSGCQVWCQAVGHADQTRLSPRDAAHRPPSRRLPGPGDPASGAPCPLPLVAATEITGRGSQTPSSHSVLKPSRGCPVSPESSPGSSGGLCVIPRLA